MLGLSCSAHDILRDRPFVRQTKLVGDLTQRCEVREQQQQQRQEEQQQWEGSGSRKDFPTFSDRTGSVPRSGGSRAHSHLYRSVKHKSPPLRLSPEHRAVSGKERNIKAAPLIRPLLRPRPKPRPSDPMVVKFIGVRCWASACWLKVFSLSLRRSSGGGISSGIFQGTHAISSSTPFNPAQQVSRGREEHFKGPILKAFLGFRRRLYRLPETSTFSPLFTASC